MALLPRPILAQKTTKKTTLHAADLLVPSCFDIIDKQMRITRHFYTICLNTILREKGIIFLDASIRFADNFEVPDRVRDALLRSHFSWVNGT
jgi:hypothetical protein